MSFLFEAINEKAMCEKEVSLSSCTQMSMLYLKTFFMIEYPFLAIAIFGNFWPSLAIFVWSHVWKESVLTKLYPNVHALLEDIFHYKISIIGYFWPFLSGTINEKAMWETKVVPQMSLLHLKTILFSIRSSLLELP